MKYQPKRLVGAGLALLLLAGCSAFRSHTDEMLSQSGKQKYFLRHYDNPQPEGLGQDARRYDLPPVEIRGIFSGLRAQRYRYLSWEDPVQVFGKDAVEFLAGGLSEGLKKVKPGERMVFSLRDENGFNLDGEIFCCQGILHFLLWVYHDDRFYLENRPPDSVRATWRLVPGAGQAYHRETGSFRTVEYPYWLEIPIPETPGEKL